MIGNLWLTILLACLIADPALATADPVTSKLPVSDKWKGWDRMTVTMPDFMAPSRNSQIPDFLKQIWSKEIAANDRDYRDQRITGPDGKPLLSHDGHAPADALYSTYRDGDATIIVSMLFAKNLCELGPSDFNSDQIHSTCPVRIVVQRGQTGKRVDYPNACFLDSTFDVSPGKSREGFPDPSINASLTRFDAKAGLIDLIAIRDNRSLPECAKRLKIPGL